ncbi:MAG TPA: glycosyltransferase [Candidatus Woesearchaeota archaeon]|nr:glycosyltransferase [Candidatus Woesearchaeota archaeon]
MPLKVNFVVPVYNEEKVLEASVRKLAGYFRNNLSGYEWKIIIADNASTDSTLQIARRLEKIEPGVKAFHIDRKGRGFALVDAWKAFPADIYAYCDVDLATGISHTRELIDAVASGFEIATGCRYHPKSRVERKMLRLILSKAYNRLAHAMLDTEISDLQCGFKAVSQRVLDEIVPLTKDKEWFFDSELLVIAERKGFSIKEIPVDWKESKRSKVRIFRIIRDYLRDLRSLRKRLESFE